MDDKLKIQQTVRDRYAAAARGALDNVRTGCCGPKVEGSPGCGCGTAEKDSISEGIYPDTDVEGLPSGAVLASLGCGNPTALAELRPGEVVLDLGSGGGIDVLLSARRVGPEGKAYGIDMTDEMLDLARRNQAEAGVTNAEFLKGAIEDLPLPDEEVDVIISNCVINLSVDKDRVLREAHRVLRPGGRFAVSDVVFRGEVPEALRERIEAWAGCVSGALHERDYRAKLAGAGFEEIDVEIVRTYDPDELEALAGEAGLALDEEWFERGEFCSAFIRARKATRSGGSIAAARAR